MQAVMGVLSVRKRTQPCVSLVSARMNRTPLSQAEMLESDRDFSGTDSDELGSNQGAPPPVHFRWS
jgi:hypothetical protein